MSAENTFLGKTGVSTLLQTRKKLWFIGIGGVHMSALALFCRAQGFWVAGSDTHAGDAVKRLRAQGISVYIGHHPARVAEYDAVIYTLAISAEDPEYLAALGLGLPVLSRADLLGALTGAFSTRIGVAGSHGKSTVTAMLDAIFAMAERDPTTFCGALLPSGATVRYGKGDTCIFEACEYKDSFLCLSPTVAMVLNTDFDHADFFRDEAQLLTSFQKFANGANALIREAENAALTHPHTRTFGIDRGDCHAEKLRFEGGRGCFSLVWEGSFVGEIALAVLGEHNVKNALAAALCALDAGVSPTDVINALGTFPGASRRMSYRGLFRGAALFDDYAHHPAEIRATLTAARQLTPKTGRLFAVFQPHTYTRTKAFFADFCAALRLADRVIVADIYPARETDTLGMSAALLAKEIGACAVFVGGLGEIARTLGEELSAGDTAVIMGAGDIDRLFGQICANHFTLS